MSDLIELSDVMYGQHITLSQKIVDPDRVDVVVTTLIHNHPNGPIPAVESFLQQKSKTNSIMLILDDGTSDYVIEDSRIYIARIPECNVARGRNFAYEICRQIFPNDTWICRLDSDDTLQNEFALRNIHNQIKNMHIQWALAGNDLILDDEKLTRDNPVTADFKNHEFVLSRLEKMADGEETAELPSCNLWKRNSFRIYYPEVDSAEDHWLVSKLLLKHQDKGQILTGFKHANYHLKGNNTQNNILSGKYSESRQLLYNSLNTNSTSIECIDWGLEGMVFRHSDKVVKTFNKQTINEEQISWLSSLDDAPILKVSWEAIDGQWTATSKFQPNNEPEDVSREMISRFISSCIKSRIVCLNVNKKNMYIDEKNALSYIDIGSSIVPFEARFFRDMCLRLYLSFVLGYSSHELSVLTKTFRNNIGQMKKFEGFEDFFSREVQLYNLNQGFFRKPARDIKADKVNHENTTLLIKTCAMDYRLIRNQVQHIVRQVTRFDIFEKTVLLIDPKRTNFLRQHDDGNLDRLFDEAQRLKKENWIDDILISPNEDKRLVMHCLEEWFGLSSISTHTKSGVPLFPQLWGFEQIQTRYVFQMDCDVLFHCSVDDKSITEMHEAIKLQNTFGVGFNIPQDAETHFNAYQGSFVPEVRCGLFDLKRLLQQRPYPNNLVDKKFERSWYRSIEKFQNMSDWQSLRGGFGSTYYIHPMNSVKKNFEFYDRCIDLVEQGKIPDEQRGHWDIVESEHLWKYEERKEKLVFYTHTRKPIQHFLRGLVVSIAKQVDVDAGLVIFCDQTKSNKLEWLLELISEHPGKITIVRKRFSEFSKDVIGEYLSEICTNNQSKIIELNPREILFDKMVCKELIALNGENINLRAHLVHRPLGIEHKVSYYAPDNHNLALSTNEQNSEGISTNGFDILNYDRKFSNSLEDERRTNYIPNLNKLEIDITYFCNLTCAGCSRSSAQAPSNMHMPIQMIQEFLESSSRKGKQWESIHILGGEPTLHPNFVEIIMMIEEWLEQNSPDTERKVISNGVSRKTIKNLSAIPKKWRYDNSFKHDREAATQHFEPFNYAPKDIEEWKNQDFTKGCYITQDSGIGLSPYGYHHCAIAGGIERIFNFGLGFDELPDHPWQFLDMMKTYCALCGHFLSDIPLERSQRKVMDIDPGLQSPSWKKGYKLWGVNGDA